MNQHIKTTDSIIGPIIIWLLLLCVALTTARAATITVSNSNDSGAGSLRQALVDANDGDTIDFGITGTIMLTSGQLVVDKRVAINGAGANTLAVDANHASRVFYIASGKDVTISGLTIRNGSGPANDFGGGIYNDHATLTVNNCTISGNSASLDGGGLCNNGYGGSATMTITNSTLSGNSGRQGGGIFNNGYLGTAMVTVNNSTLSGNSCGNVGGGICNIAPSGSAPLTINNSTLSGNSGGNVGGGICNVAPGGSAPLTINSSTLSGNSARYGGGGITNDGRIGSTPLTINNSTFSGNSADFGGGILNDGSYDGSAPLTVNNSTFSRNSATTEGGSIYNYAANDGSAPLTIGDTVLSAGASGGNIYNNAGTVTSLGYNLSNDDGGGFLTATGDQINADPMLGPLQDNGGPTFTHALLTGSPAIDTGKNFTAATTDQRGSAFARTFDDASIANANGGDGTDIGAFEVQPPAPTYAGHVQPPINPDGSSTFNVRRGVVPVKFNLTQGGVATCDLPPATIAVTRTAGGVIGPVNESDYSGNADTGSNFRISSCQYVYNLNARALGIGTYRVDVLIDGQVIGNAVFALN